MSIGGIPLEGPTRISRRLAPVGAQRLHPGQLPPRRWIPRALGSGDFEDALGAGEIRDRRADALLHQAGADRISATGIRIGRRCVR